MNSDSNNQNLIKINAGLAQILAGGNFNLNVILKDISVLNTDIAGVYYQKPEKFAQDIAENDIITLKREPENKFDHLAIALYYKKIKIGYIPKAKNEVLAKLIDAGKQFSGKIIKKNNQNDYDLQLTIEVFMKG